MEKTRSKYRLESFDDFLAEDLRDPEIAYAYLKDALAESPEEFLIALREYVQANGGMTEAARKSGIRREVLYRTLSEAGNPRLSTFNTLIRAFGFGLDITRRPKAALQQQQVFTG